MELKQDFLEKVTNCNWFANCGDQNFDKFEVILINDKNEIPESMRSHKWENIYLAKRGDFYSSIFLNHREQYGLMNEEFDKAKKEVLTFSKRVTAGLKKKEIRFDGLVLENVIGDLQILFMINHFSEYYTPDIYYERLLEIYLSGYLPCGWSGGQKNGIFKVY